MTKANDYEKEAREFTIALGEEGRDAEDLRTIRRTAAAFAARIAARARKEAFREANLFVMDNSHTPGCADADCCAACQQADKFSEHFVAQAKAAAAESNP